MKLSVVIPTRHRDEALGRSLESLRPQIVAGQDEVIVTDDGTVDSTRRMIEARFPFARWTAGPRRGPAANRNHGASLAGGDFILFLDDDVEPGPALLASYRAAVTPSVDVYEGRTTCLKGLHSPLEHAPINETGGCLWTCNMMLRTSFWQAFGGFDEDFPYAHMEDVAFRERLAAKGARTLFVPGATVDHPPRLLPPGPVLARQHESYVIYSYKYQRRPPSLREFAGILLRHRLGAIRAHPPSRASVIALGSLCVEAAHTLRSWHAWDVKWRAALRATPRHE